MFCTLLHHVIVNDHGMNWTLELKCGFLLGLMVEQPRNSARCIYLKNDPQHKAIDIRIDYFTLVLIEIILYYDYLIVLISINKKTSSY